MFVRESRSPEGKGKLNGNRSCAPTRTCFLVRGTFSQEAGTGRWARPRLRHPPVPVTVSVSVALSNRGEARPGLRVSPPRCPTPPVIVSRPRPRASVPSAFLPVCPATGGKRERVCVREYHVNLKGPTAPLLTNVGTTTKKRRIIYCQNMLQNNTKTTMFHHHQLNSITTDKYTKMG
ncbi:uncharacterized protein NDAI_0A01760 [Naumovozyma dairenensis CBS 421]|uniref:Uncharacterized protein n=1 Tax=Naumovozyma dairenensis (strain ATCC 10597 / BCRC 20456 / CBS 421 / NBRC 0211 / NRRL Y-12639) TaxID=1071378 RepID=G0W3E6_NAUDC|nr:hypothetical protein NDAI_0A01760 [Naumovozyma dairenensis CBS 421]CCD22334.1 hypothetical protein NDAI_0A01760 [Naumovozyma dairenensis CBS 421]